MSSEISLLDALAKIAAMTVRENLLHALSSPDAHTYIQDFSPAPVPVPVGNQWSGVAM